MTNQDKEDITQAVEEALRRFFKDKYIVLGSRTEHVDAVGKVETPEPPRKHPYSPGGAFHYWLALGAASACLWLCSCASPQLAPTFHAPASTPISQAHKAIATSVTASTSHIQQAQTIVKEVQVADPTLKLQLDHVSNLLDQALADNVQALADKQTAENALATYETQVDTDLVKPCNDTAQAYTKVLPELKAAQDRGNAWLKRCIYLGVACAGLLAWTFKGPLSLLTGV